MSNANGTHLDALGCDGRGVFIHRVLTTAESPMRPAEIGEQAQQLAYLAKYPDIKENTFSPGSVSNHLRFMKEHGYAETVGRGMWQLTELARRKINDSATQS